MGNDTDGADVDNVGDLVGVRVNIEGVLDGNTDGFAVDGVAVDGATDDGVNVVGDAVGKLVGDATIFRMTSFPQSAK